VHLGGTFYLLEIIKEEEGVPQYTLESEDHHEGFSFDIVFRIFSHYAAQYGCTNDCLSSDERRLNSRAKCVG
jgi:hypothetical protein